MWFVVVGVAMLVMNLAGIGPIGEWTWAGFGKAWFVLLPFGLAVRMRIILGWRIYGLAVGIAWLLIMRISRKSARPDAAIATHSQVRDRQRENDNHSRPINRSRRVCTTP